MKRRKGRGKGQLALEDGTVEEEDGKKEEEEEDDGKSKKDPWDEAKNKARKARDLCQGAASNLEESLTKARGTNRLSKGHKKDAEDLLAQSAKAIEKIKGFLVKRPSGMSLEQAKELTIHATKVTKELKDHRDQSAAASGEGLWKEEAMQGPCQKGPWSLAKRFPIGCTRCWYPKGLHFLAKREYIPDPCQKVLVVFKGSFGQKGLNQQSLDQRDCAQTGVRLKKSNWVGVWQGCSTGLFY